MCIQMLLEMNVEFAALAGGKWKDSLENPSTSNFLGNKGLQDDCRMELRNFRAKLQAHNRHI